MMCVVVPTRDKATRLRWTLKALARELSALTEGGEVVVVDDGSVDDSREILTEWSASSPAARRIVRHTTPGGRSVARNRGAAASRGDPIVFLDDDVLVVPGTLRHLYECHRKSQREAVLRGDILSLPWMRELDDPAEPPATYPPMLADRCHRVGALLGDPALLVPLARRTRFESMVERCLAGPQMRGKLRWLGATGGILCIARDTFEGIGGFDEAMGLDWGVEDLELGYRLEQENILVSRVPGAIGVHLDHRAQDREVGHARAIDYFGAKHGRAVGMLLRGVFLERDGFGVSRSAS